jgi:AraC family transcriptional regulator of adaptative response / DNA-3-methyladenine glycosylase II
MAVASMLERETCLRRFYGREPGSDGAFLVGVLTTGIYCLPSCRARKPRPENVRFFPDEGGARAAGLRPCRRCHPERFYAGIDPERGLARDLFRRVRTRPADFVEAGDLARSAGIGATKLHALCRRQFQLSPGALLVRERVRRARALLAGAADLARAAAESGFESSSAFHENFRRLCALTPAAYRGLGRKTRFVLQLPAGPLAQGLASLFGRDPEGRCERVRGALAEKALVLEGIPARIRLRFAGRELTVELESARALPPSAAFTAHALVQRWLGLESDPAPFERRAARSGAIARLVRGREGLRIPLTSDPFEGLVWVIVGAQVNVAFAAGCRAELCVRAGTPCSDGLFAHPTPAQVAELELSELRRLRFSRRKAEYLLDAARAIVQGELDLDCLALEPVPAVDERLSAVRGLGPWSVQYLLMRAYGFEDCVPAGDSALATALERFFARPERPDPDETRELMEPFAPQRSLATYHLWKTL